jgi:hypothetical protein
MQHLVRPTFKADKQLLSAGLADLQDIHRDKTEFHFLNLKNHHTCKGTEHK